MTLAALIERLDRYYASMNWSVLPEKCELSKDEWQTLRDALPVWRPIETIPPHIHHALLTGGEFTWDDNLGSGAPLDFVACATFDTLYKEWRDGEFSYEPTHWMPLPAALNPKAPE